MDADRRKPCTKPAEFYSNYHACDPTDPSIGTGSILWCADHLTQKTLFIQKQINAHPNQRVICRTCKKTLPNLKDWIWGTTPIR